MEMPSAEHPLMILALDHRDSFEKTLFHAENPTAEQLTAMRRAKTLVYEGLLAARSDLGDGAPGVLVDELLGADVQRRAHGDGITLAVPVEKSGERLFSLDYGDDTAAHVAASSPDLVKVLVRMNPSDSAQDIDTQLERLAKLSTWLRDEVHIPFLYELLVPASEDQLASVGGDKDAYDRDVRPGLVVEVIKANQEAGVEPALWKIEGLETTDAAREVVRAARAGGRDKVGCIVLGRDAPQDRLDHWLTVAAGVDGFVGFAIGRSIWEDAIEAHLKDGDDDHLIETVRVNYTHFAQTYLDARRGVAANKAD
jgi:myo-inositol catabolism protein IolC